MADQYAWNVADGEWGTPGNWRDLTTGATPALAAPDSANQVAIAGPSSGAFRTITGIGAAASLSFAADVVVLGQLSAGSLSVASGGTVIIGAGGSIADDAALVGPGVVQVSGSSARFSTGGLLTVSALASAPGSGVVQASNHAAVQAGTLVLAGGTLSADATASIEVGGSSRGQLGFLSIDACATLTSMAGLITTAVTDNGVLVATAGETRVFGAISGDGTLEIGAAGTLYLPGAVAAATNIAFTSSDGVLQLTSFSKQFAGAISGFSQGDAIDIAVGSVTGASWSGGILTLTVHNAPVMSLRLDGNFNGAVFLARPDGNGGSMVTLAPTVGGTTNGSGAAGAGTATPDLYAWIAPTGGAWGDAANWSDLTASQSPAVLAPGSNDIVALIGPTNHSALLLTGQGNSASLDVAGNVTLSGRFTTGALLVGGAPGAGELDVGIGSTLLATSVSLGTGGVLNVSGGSKLTVSGTVSLTSVNPGGGVLSLSDSSFGKFAGLVLAGGTISLDGASAIEIGSTGIPAGSAITVDAGATLTSTGGLITAGIAVRGTLLAGGGRTSVLKGVTGGGTLQIGANATLALAGSVAANNAVGFLASGGVLQLGATGSQFAGSITGFGQSDAIDITHSLLTDAAWAAGTLTLSIDGAPAMSLRLTGNYAGAVFLATPDGSGGTVVTLAAGATAASVSAASAGTAAAESFIWTASAGGDWGNAGNWTDVTSGAAIAPGANDIVGIAGGTGPGFQLLTGQGNAANLGVTGNVALAGTVATGALAIGLPGSVGVLDLIAGGLLTAGSATVGAGALLVNGAGAALQIAGTLSVAGAAPGSATVSVSNGGALHAGGVILAGGTLGVDAAGILEIGMAAANLAGALLIDPGATLASAGGVITAPVVDNGTLLVTMGTTSLFGAITGSGAVLIGDGATLALICAGGGGRGSFAGPGGTLRLGPAGSAAGAFAGTITGFAAGAAIILANTILTDASFDAGTLSLGNDGSIATTLRLDGSYDSTAFLATSDGLGGTRITLAGTAAACFAAGTRIRTASGETAVEALRPGDLVVTLSGRGAPLKRIVWIGWRRIELAHHPNPADVAPIRVAAHALAPGMPHRDLRLSPDHAIFVGGAGGPGEAGALIPVRHLVNGATIRREPAIGSVMYFHVELSAHDLLLAEGLPAESYLDTGNRGAFANGGAATQLHMDPRMHTAQALRIWRERACARLLLYGEALTEARRRLLRRAPSLGWHMLADPDLRLLAGGGSAAPSIEGDRYCFDVPVGARQIRLVSRGAVPGEMQADNPDHRRLGVAVAAITLDGAPFALDGSHVGQGWHAPEAGLRWTDGDATLVLPPAKRVRRLAVTLRPLLQYWWRADDATSYESRRSPARRRAC